MLGQMQMSIDGEVADKIDTAIRRLQAFEPEDGYFVAFSGGKDSQCIYHLCNICKHEKEPKPCTAESGCWCCKFETCPRKRCYVTHGKEGYEWDGGANDDV